VFWNHPGFRVARAEWFPLVAEAYPWIEEKRLTILANSDAHDPVPPLDRGWVRPMTLIFARTTGGSVSRPRPRGAGLVSPGAGDDRGRTSFDVGLVITNLHIGPGRNLTVQMPMTIEVRR
jgi:hypothetical protein